MFAVNEYFEGKVKSIGFQSGTLPATIGVMSKGEYTFNTDCKEIMTVVNGHLEVQLPGEEKWYSFTNGQVFEIDAGEKFDLKIKSDTAYMCQYVR